MSKAADAKRVINYWRKSSQKDWEVAQSLFKLGHYNYCLFFCHLTIEKLLKGLVVIQTRKAAPYIHDLAKLAETAQLNVSKEQIKTLRIITNFNISARYKDKKLEFYKQCTKAYATKYLNISKELYLWLKKQYQKK